MYSHRHTSTGHHGPAGRQERQTQQTRHHIVEDQRRLAVLVFVHALVDVFVLVEENDGPDGDHNGENKAQKLQHRRRAHGQIAEDGDFEIGHRITGQQGQKHPQRQQQGQGAEPQVDVLHDREGFRQFVLITQQVAFKAAQRGR